MQAEEELPDPDARVVDMAQQAGQLDALRCAEAVKRQPAIGQRQADLDADGTVTILDMVTLQDGYCDCW